MKQKLVKLKEEIAKSINTINGRTSLQKIARDREDSTLNTGSNWHLWNTPPNNSWLLIHLNTQRNTDPNILIWYWNILKTEVTVSNIKSEGKDITTDPTGIIMLKKKILWMIS